MYQDDPEVKVALINAATQIVRSAKGSGSDELRQSADAYLVEMFDWNDDTGQTDDPPGEINDG